MSHTTARWALILGASSGFGAAAGRELAKHGYHIAGIHLDRKGTLGNVDALVNDIKAAGRQALFYNINAADAEKRQEVVTRLQQALHASNPKGQVFVMMHSLAFGSLKPYIAQDPKEAVNQDQIEMTMNVMAHSLVYWAQDLFTRQLIGQGSRIYAMTSSGGTRVWPNYGAVSAAKAALESHMRQLALELAPHGVAVNTIRAGVTDTPALRKIPGHEEMIKFSVLRNPHHRLTTPEDVAKAIVALSAPETQWLTGNVLGVDGGEDIVG